MNDLIKKARRFGFQAMVKNFEQYSKESWLEPLLLAEEAERRKQGALRIGTCHLKVNSLRMTLTAHSIDELVCPPEKRHLILRDSILKGFGVRITSSGCKSYFIEHRVNGHKRRAMIGKCNSISLEEARTRAKALLKDAKVGGRNDAKPPAATLGEVLEEYLKVRISLRPSSCRAYRNVTKQRLGDWLGLPVTDITRQMVEQRHREISTVGGQWKASKVQANNALRILKLLLNFASEHYADENGTPLLPMNPVSSLSRNKCWHRIPNRQGIIADHKLAHWYRSVMDLRNCTVRDYLLLVLFTGLRRVEAMTLRWTDIDFESRVLTVKSEASKNHREHRLPLCSFLLNLLKRRKAESKSEWLFPGRGGHLVQICHVTEELKKRSGIKFSPHDLRRTFLTTAEKLDLPYYVLKRLANHSGSRDVTFGYIIPDVERLRKPMQIISDWLLLKLLVDDQP